MLQAERYKMICAHVQKQGAVRVTELSQLCQVSQETIRRDLTKLEKNKKLTRSFGGAVSLDVPDITSVALDDNTWQVSSVDRAESFRKRTEEHPDSKAKIAKAALQFIHPGDCILMDNSSTCWFLARQIPDIDITVVTNSLRIIQALACRDKVRIIGVGGEYSERHDDFHGPVAESAIRNFQINSFFFSCQGLNLENGIRDGSEINARLKQVMLQVSAKKILMVDSSKFEQFAFSKICMLDEIDIMVTDSCPDERYRSLHPQLNVVEINKS
ncbi:DeoR/GlpR transcriptional regulator [Citrobacter sp. ku-bf4]|uniref:DeoR/GlpR family DNA-binding transcription regulator n=1 Tax=Citrobacter TaxID=544 RepID=UPI00197FBD0C|nr:MULTISPECIES: DeoR/GlpR family DNA-binding transcription regulator [Citrobacter]MBN6046488.1 DeoR/GlpR transcriptional regulator [Citrobacter sp. ku-bf4]MBS0827864.1 DeoR/GlpR transcriptional regulator [Citrobacter amalonaticus]